MFVLFECQCKFVFVITHPDIGKIYGPFYEELTPHTMTYEQWEQQYGDCEGAYIRTVNAQTFGKEQQ
jgi:hypothetical protein